jgi:hypothetical protein
VIGVKIKMKDGSVKLTNLEESLRQVSQGHYRNSKYDIKKHKGLVWGVYEKSGNLIGTIHYNAVFRAYSIIPENESVVGRWMRITDFIYYDEALQLARSLKKAGVPYQIRENLTPLYKKTKDIYYITRPLLRSQKHIELSEEEYRDKVVCEHNGKEIVTSKEIGFDERLELIYREAVGIVRALERGVNNERALGRLKRLTMRLKELTRSDNGEQG